MRQKAFTAVYFGEHKVFWILSFFTVFFIGLYLYFVSASIVNVIMREEMILKAASAHSRISELESEYLAQKNKITEELAEELGFVSISEKHFVARKPFGRELTLRE